MIDTNMTRRSALEIALAGGAAALAGSAANAASPPAAGGDWQFLVGRWHVRHRKLRERLVGSNDWMEFEGSCENWPILGGAANVDDNIFHTPDETYRGVGLRAYDPATKSWAIWWLDSRRADRLDVLVRGTFESGVGTFLAEDSWKGTPVTVRFRWSDITPRSAKWEQAFSTDGGATWEVNWVMHFTRA